MNYEAMRQAILDRFNTQLDAARPGINIREPNERFREPANTEWVSIEFLDEPRVQATIGSAAPLMRHNGAIYVRVYIPPDRSDGDLLAVQIADDVDAIFRRAAFSQGASGRFRFDMGTRGTGFKDEAGWYQLPLTYEFQRDVFDS